MRLRCDSVTPGPTTTSRDGNGPPGPRPTGTPAEVLDRVAAELDAEWPADRIAGYLDGLGR